MWSQEKLNEIAADIQGFFTQATTDPAHNQGLARQLIVKYGTKEAIEGFAFAIIGDDIRSAPNMLALSHALNGAIYRMGLMIDFVSSRGETEAKAVLGAIIMTSTDEDICALASIIFASPHFADPVVKNVLLERYNRSEGTSCRIALSLALFQCGEEAQLRSFMASGYIPNYDYPDATPEQQRKIMKGVIPQFLMPIIMKIVLEDCATDGKGVDVLYRIREKSLPWKRKKYDN